MRRRCLNGSVAARGRQRPLGQGRVVVGVDEIGRRSRMGRVITPYGLKDGSCLELARISLVEEVDSFEDRERIESLRFGIRRVGGRELLHGGLVGLRALRLRAIVAIVDSKRLDESLLAGCRLDDFGTFQKRASGLERFSVEIAAEWVATRRHGGT